MKQQSEVSFEHPAHRYESRCELCAHWVEDNQCKVVEGNVYSDDWCRLWVKNEHYPASAYRGE